MGLNYDSSLKRFEIAFRGIPYIEKNYMDIKYYDLIKPALAKMAQLYNLFMGRKSFPYYIAENVLEIPVLGISDYSLIESPKGPRYTPENCIKIGDIWLENLKYVKRRGGLLVIQAHPGRISPNYIRALSYFVKNALKQGAAFKTLDSVALEFRAEKSSP